MAKLLGGRNTLIGVRRVGGGVFFKIRRHIGIS